MDNFLQYSAEQQEEYDDDEDEEQMRTLFCHNLDERVTEEILYEVFLQAGPIESARIPLDNTGRQRNFGFVTYQHRSAVPYAVKLYQGLELFHKKVSIRSQSVRPRHGSSGNATK
ncbi:RNA-binding protein 7-like [Drosophila albomicans]|uniref:RNA-binding protein 7-like n=1 Tax=Drosophila albomicans TaxID=7291 RepID=A0A6P8XEZ3_DROAB|nr:RNA-binding protein 7-like [Drosophila albomicans]